MNERKTIRQINNDCIVFIAKCIQTFLIVISQIFGKYTPSILKF